MAADPVAKLRSVGRTLPPKVRAEVLALAPGIIPHLVEILDGDGWAALHAADLLIQLKAAEAIAPMLRVLAEVDFEDELFNRVAVRLPELGTAVLEPALTFLAAHEDDDDTIRAVCEVLAKL